MVIFLQLFLCMYFWHASEADLHDLALTKKGPLISLKGACACAKSNDGRTPKSKEILVESMKKAG